MVGNIINQLGGGSGIDTHSLVEQLVSLEKAPQEKRLDKREELLQTQISDYGLLRSAIGNLESAVMALKDPATFNAKAVALPQTSLLALTKLDAKAVPGNYRVQVEQIAQSQSLLSDSFTSEGSQVGQGTLSFNFGDWDNGDFTVNTAKPGFTVTIDESNNTLRGLRDAINASGSGVQASIVSEGGVFRLQLTSPSGQTQQLRITASEAPGEPGLGTFAFNETEQAMTQLQEGKDALIRVNGLLLSRPSNHVTDVIPGLEMDVYNSSASEVVNINITADRSVAEDAIRDFVDTYNKFLKETERLVGFDAEIDDYGSLHRDALANSMLQSIRNMLGSSVPGLEGGFSALANLGIRTKLDGSLEILEDGSGTDFRAAMDNNFELVKDLFVPKTSSNSSLIQVTGHSARTQPGNYEVEILSHATRGGFTGGPVVEGFPLDTTGKDYSFRVRVNGVVADTLSLPDGKVYGSGEELAQDFQMLINQNSKLQAAFASVTVTFNGDTGALEFLSTEYGNESVVSFASVGADMADLGIAAGQGTIGKNVSGLIGGVQGFGYGKVLLPAIGSPAEGLSMIIEPGATGGTISFSRGFAGSLTEVLDSFLKGSGMISERESNIKKDMERISDSRETLERRSDAYRARLEAQFLAMEQIVRSLNNTNTFLDGILDRLPFTAPRK